MVSRQVSIISVMVSAEQKASNDKGLDMNVDVKG